MTPVRTYLTDIAVAREKYVIPMPATSRRTFLAAGTAVSASLLLGRIVRAESLRGVDGSLLKEYDIATIEIFINA